MEIKIRAIQEHDLDLFLVEECSSNPPFLQWLIHRVYGEDFDVSQLIEIGNSTNTPSGESDVEIWFLDESEKNIVCWLNIKSPHQTNPNKVNDTFKEGITILSRAGVWNLGPC